MEAAPVAGYRAVKAMRIAMKLQKTTHAPWISAGMERAFMNRTIPTILRQMDAPLS